MSPEQLAESPYRRSSEDLSQEDLQRLTLEIVSSTGLPAMRVQLSSLQKELARTRKEASRSGLLAAETATRVASLREAVSSLCSDFERMRADLGELQREGLEGSPCARSLSLAFDAMRAELRGLAETLETAPGNAELQEAIGRCRSELEAVSTEVRSMRAEWQGAAEGSHLADQLKEVIQEVLPRVIEHEECLEKELSEAKRAIEEAKAAAEADSRELVRKLSTHLGSVEGLLFLAQSARGAAGGGGVTVARSPSSERTRSSCRSERRRGRGGISDLWQPMESPQWAAGAVSEAGGDGAHAVELTPRQRGAQGLQAASKRWAAAAVSEAGGDGSQAVELTPRQRGGQGLQAASKRCDAPVSSCTLPFSSHAQCC